MRMFLEVCALCVSYLTIMHLSRILIFSARSSTMCQFDSLHSSFIKGVCFAAASWPSHELFHCTLQQLVDRGEHGHCEGVRVNGRQLPMISCCHSTV